MLFTNLSFYSISKTTMTRQLRPPPTSPSITTPYRRVLFWFVHFIVSFLLLICHFHSTAKTTIMWQLLPTTHILSLHDYPLSKGYFWVRSFDCFIFIANFFFLSNWKTPMTRELHLHTSSHSSAISFKRVHFIIIVSFSFLFLIIFFCMTTMTSRHFVYYLLVLSLQEKSDMPCAAAATSTSVVHNWDGKKKTYNLQRYEMKWTGNESHIYSKSPTTRFI